MAALKLKQDDQPAETRCPSCGASLPEDAVLCVQCGYDLRSGCRIDDEAAPRGNPVLIAGVALLVAVAAGLLAWRMLGSQPPPPPVTVVPPPAVVAPVIPSPPAPAPIVTNASTNAVAANVTTSNAVVAAVDTNSAPAAPVLDPVVVEAEQREAVVTQLDKVAPLYVVGDELELRLTNGVVQRGIFSSRSEDRLVIQVSSNQTRTMEFVQLDRGSRVRSDPQYRARYIDYHVQQRVQKILHNEAISAEAK